VSNLPPNPYDRTKIVEPPIENPDRAVVQGSGKDFVVTFTDTVETPGAEDQVLSRTGKWVTVGTAGLTPWGGIVGDIEDQADLMAMFDTKADISDLHPVAFSGNYNQLINKPPLGTVSPINLNGDTSQVLHGDGQWRFPTDVYATWGSISGDINAQADLMALLNAKAPNLSPVFTGIPRAPTPSVDDNSDRIATTGWFFGQAFNGLPEMDGVGSSGDSTRWARGNHRHPGDTTKIGDAPNDGQQYARQSLNWTVVTGGGGGGGGFTNGETEPVTKALGDRWYVPSTGRLYTWVNDGDSTQWVELPAGSFSAALIYDVGGGCTGVPTASLVLMRYPFPRAATFPAGLTSSKGVVATAATAQTDFNLLKNGVSFGTMRFAVAGTVATFIAVSATSFAVGDVLTVVAPASPDATLANIGFTLAGTR